MESVFSLKHLSTFTDGKIQNVAAYGIALSHITERNPTTKLKVNDSALHTFDYIEGDWLFGKDFR